MNKGDFISFSEEELAGKPPVGEEAFCPNCSQKHPVQYGETVLPDGTREECKDIAYVTCSRGRVFLVGYNGRQVR